MTALLLGRQLSGCLSLVVLGLWLLACGAMAGRRLRAGAAGAAACGITFLAGGSWALVSAVATETMGGESALAVVSYLGLTWIVAWGAGAGTGFALAPRHGLKVLGAAVLWFTIGGALAGIVLGAVVVASGLFARAGLAIAVGFAAATAFTIGGAGLQSGSQRTA